MKVDTSSNVTQEKGRRQTGRRGQVRPVKVGNNLILDMIKRSEPNQWNVLEKGVSRVTWIRTQCALELLDGVASEG